MNQSEIKQKHKRSEIFYFSMSYEFFHDDPEFMEKLIANSSLTNQEINKVISDFHASKEEKET